MLPFSRNPVPPNIFFLPPVSFVPVAGKSVSQVLCCSSSADQILHCWQQSSSSSGRCGSQVSSRRLPTRQPQRSHDPRLFPAPLFRRLKCLVSGGALPQHWVIVRRKLGAMAIQYRPHFRIGGDALPFHGDPPGGRTALPSHRCSGCIDTARRR